MWLYITSIVLSLVTANALFNSAAFTEALNQSLVQAGADVRASDVSQSLLLLSLCATPFAAAFNLLRYIVIGIVIHEIARRVVGKDVQVKRNALFYLLGAIAAPLTLVSAFAAILPTTLGTILALGLLAFQIFLFMQVAKTLYEVDTQKAFTIAGLPMIVLLILQVVFLGALI
jgi:hypothetical protein